MLAYSRPFWPLFLHVLGAMTLFGAILAAVILSLRRLARRPSAPFLRKATFWALVSRRSRPTSCCRVGAQWIYSKEGFSGTNDPTWIGIGFGVADAGLLVLLAAIGCAYWWMRSGKPVAGRIVAGISSALPRRCSRSPGSR